jgi:UDP:flavonoid glycosyltransferase YjiC (YdhE family)
MPKLHASAAAAVKTVLFAWELGAGSGHLMNIRRLARRLHARGIRVVAAVTNLSAIAALDGIFTEIHRMPNWRSAASDPAQGSVPSSATLNDMLVTAGLADAAFVEHVTSAWVRLLRTVDPALVVADFAPAAALAARQRVPLLLIGNGYTLPPHEMHSFPPLHELSPPLHREDVTLAAVNAAAHGLALHPLQRLPELFSGDARVVHTAPLFDPYARFRQRPVDGPLIDYVPRPRLADAAQVFAYISQGVEVRRDVIAALRPIASRLRIHAPMLSDEARDELAQGGAAVEPNPVDLSRMLHHCRLVVHLGGSGLATEALLAGIPQFVLVTHVEQHLTGIALERAGIGRLFTAYDAARTLAADAILDLLQDDTIAQRAADGAALHRKAWANGAALEAFDRACARLLP